MGTNKQSVFPPNVAQSLLESACNSLVIVFADFAKMSLKISAGNGLLLDKIETIGDLGHVHGAIGPVILRLDLLATREWLSGRKIPSLVHVRAPHDASQHRKTRRAGASCSIYD